MSWYSDYRIQDMQDRNSRHLYDICKLLPMVKLDQNCYICPTHTNLKTYFL